LYAPQTPLRTPSKSPKYDTYFRQLFNINENMYQFEGFFAACVAVFYGLWMPDASSRIAAKLGLRQHVAVTLGLTQH
jgi:hypothetical protein